MIPRSWRVISNHVAFDSTAWEMKIFSIYFGFHPYYNRAKNTYKICQKRKYEQKSKNHIFFIFWNMIVWFKVGGNTSFGVILSAIWKVQTSLWKTPPPFCQPHENDLFFQHLKTLVEISTILVNTCWPNFFHHQKAPNLLYKTLTLIFSYIS